MYITIVLGGLFTLPWLISEKFEEKYGRDKDFTGLITNISLFIYLCISVFFNSPIFAIIVCISAFFAFAGPYIIDTYYINKKLEELEGDGN